jgi:hypothetical protein
MSKDHPQSKPGDAEPLPGQADDADHSMKEETQLGWDQAPTGSEELPGSRRHPRQGGEGGTPSKELPLDDAQEHPGTSKTS